MRTGATRAVYGRTTGVGANRHAVIDADAADEHGLRLLRSHAGGTGDPLPDTVVRAAMLIRLNQLAAAGSGVHPRMMTALQTALGVGAVPLVHARGAIGTGDLTAMAEIALTLAGIRPWAVGSLDPVAISPGDALAFVSSNAVTLAESVLAWRALDGLLRVMGPAKTGEQAARTTKIRQTADRDRKDSTRTLMFSSFLRFISGLT